MLVLKPIDNPRLFTEAQRKSAAVIRAPAVIRHQALWWPINAASDSRRIKIGNETAGTHKDSANDLRERAPQTSASDTERSKRRNAIDDYLYALYKNLRVASTNTAKSGVDRFPIADTSNSSVFLLASEITASGERIYLPNQYVDETAKAKASDLVVFKFSWWGLLATLRFELHTEYLTITSILDMSSKNQKDRELFIAGPDDNSLSDCDRPNVKCLHNTLEVLNTKLGVSTDPADFWSIHRILFEGIWETFKHDILDLDKETQFSGAFADFRALILALPDEAEPKQTSSGPEQSQRHFQGAFWREKESRSPLQAARSSEYWEPWRRLFWPLLTVKTPNVDFARQEFTVTRMLKGRALHVTALGAQPDNPVDQGCFPLRTLYLADTLNGWQLGRLVERMNHQGITRLATLMQFHKLRVAVYTMREIEANIQAAITNYFASIHELESEEKQTDRRNDVHGTEKVAEELKRAEVLEADLERSLKRIDDDIRVLNGKIDGGIEYRISRARYYMRQFFEGLPAVRARRLQGFQPYEVFVKRRVGGAFDFIDIAGEQYARMIASRTTLFQYFRAQQARCVGLRSSNANLAIERLQRAAEFVLIAALLPYYIGSILTHGLLLQALPLDHLVLDRLSTALAQLQLIDLARYHLQPCGSLDFAREIWAGVFAAGLVAAFRRYKVHHSGQGWWRLTGRVVIKLGLPIIIGLIAASFFLLVLSWWHVSHSEASAAPFGAGELGTCTALFRIAS